MVYYDLYGAPIPGGMEADYFVSGRMSAISSQCYTPPKDCPLPIKNAFDISKDVINGIGPKLKLESLEKPVVLPKPLEFKPKSKIFPWESDF